MLHIKVHESLEHVFIRSRHTTLQQKYLAQELTSRTIPLTSDAHARKI